MNRLERVAGQISDRLEHFVSHLGGDMHWEGGEQAVNNDSESPQKGVKTLLERVKLFNPRRRVDDLLRSRFAEGALTIGTFIAGSIAISRLEESLGWNHYITQLIFSLVLHPWR